MKILNVSFEPTELKDLIDLREEYFASLKASQEYYLEEQIKTAKCISILYDNEKVGYTIIENSNTILEFFVTKKYKKFAESIFDLLIEMKEIRHIICKSFDHNLLEFSLQKEYKSTIIGVLFRETITPKLDYSEDLITRNIEESDVKWILKNNENVFTDENNIRFYMENKSGIIFEKFDELIGVGIFTTIIKDKPETDIGVLVNRQFRNRGYGSQIIKYLHNMCVENNMLPQCGCAFSNISSRMAIQKAGYISNYRLIDFTVESE